MAIQTNAINATAWECAWTVHNVFFAFGEPGTGILLVCIQLDRLIAVCRPMVGAIFHSKSRCSCTTNSTTNTL